MDIVDSLLSLAQLQAGVNINCQLSGHWSLDNPLRQGQAVAHIVVKGQALLCFDDKKQVLNQGDIVFFGQGSAHCLLSDNGTFDTKPPQSLVQQGGFTLNKIGTGISDCELLCLHFHYEKNSLLFINLPNFFCTHIDEMPLRNLVALLIYESQKPNALGGVSVVNALSLTLLAMIIRKTLEKQGIGIFYAYQEPRLQGLLKAIMTNPEADWHIEKMAEFAHLSRSQLIRLFNQHLAISPHAFIHKVRLQKAAMLLKQSSQSVLAVALAVGFSSETHFSKAFKKEYGTTPSQYRGRKV